VRAIHREGYQSLHNAGVEQYRGRALRLRAGWTQVDVYRGGDLRKMKTAQHLRQIGADQVAAVRP
jgi:hypothetical protein